MTPRKPNSSQPREPVQLVLRFGSAPPVRSPSSKPRKWTATEKRIKKFWPEFKKFSEGQLHSLIIEWEGKLDRMSWLNRRRFSLRSQIRAANTVLNLYARYSRSYSILSQQKLHETFAVIQQHLDAPSSEMDSIYATIADRAIREFLKN